MHHLASSATQDSNAQMMFVEEVFFGFLFFGHVVPVSAPGLLAVCYQLSIPIFPIDR